MQAIHILNIIKCYILFISINSIILYVLKVKRCLSVPKAFRMFWLNILIIRKSQFLAPYNLETEPIIGYFLSQERFNYYVF